MRITKPLHILSVLAFLMLVLFSMPNTGTAQVINDSIHERNINKKVLRNAIVSEAAVYFGGMSYLQFIWYNDHERVPFHFYNDNAGYLQIDKFGHAYASYFESYIGYHWLRKAGVEKKKALLYGGSLGFILQFPIEVFDGLYKGWGFSTGDAIANTAGSALLVGQELLFDEQLVRFKFSFSKSEYFRDANGYLGETVFQSLFYDYNSHSYWLSMNANRLMFKDKLPPWLNVAVGYGANGMLGEFQNRTYYRGIKLPEYDRTRQFFVSLDVDWEKIPTHSPFLKKAFQAMNFIKVPFPAIEINSKGKLKGYWLYF